MYWEAPDDAPREGRRRSSLMARALEAITEEEDSCDALSYDFVCLGGGVVAGYWAAELAPLLTNGLTAAIISAYPAGVAPYERPAVSKTCLNPAAAAARDPSSAAFPYVVRGSGGEAHDAHWYAANGIALLGGRQAIRVDLDAKFLSVCRVGPSMDGNLVYGNVVKVSYKQLLVATGVRSRRLHDQRVPSAAKALQAACFCSRHPDIVACAEPAESSGSGGGGGSSDADAEEGNGGEPDRLAQLQGPPPQLMLTGGVGEGCCSYSSGRGSTSVHYLRDIGDSIKLSAAMAAAEAVAAAAAGRRGAAAPPTAVVVGGGVLGCEAAAAIATYAPHVRVRLVVRGPAVLMPRTSSTGAPEDGERLLGGREAERGSSSATTSRKAAVSAAAAGNPSFTLPIARFYESHLERAGVKLLHGYRAARLWSVDDEGEYRTLDGHKASAAAAFDSSEAPALPSPLSLPPQPRRSSCDPRRSASRGQALSSPSAQQQALPSRRWSSHVDAAAAGGSPSARASAGPGRAVSAAVSGAADAVWPGSASSTSLSSPARKRPSAGRSSTSSGSSRALLAPLGDECRGVVLVDEASGEELAAAARLVVFAIGSSPNVELFRGQLQLADDGGIAVDASLRASHSSRCVFAAGDVASYSASSASSEGGGRCEHVEVARAAAVHTARAMLVAAAAAARAEAAAVAGAAALTGAAPLPPFEFLPQAYSRFLGLSWRWYGSMEGEPVAIGSESGTGTPESADKSSTGSSAELGPPPFAVVWLRNKRICGSFVEGVTSEEALSLCQLVKNRQRVASRWRVANTPLAAVLRAPEEALAPPPAPRGVFYADTDERVVAAAFRRRERCGKVTISDLGCVMRDLGADWDAVELAAALRGLDPRAQGTVDFETFQKWWAA